MTKHMLNVTLITCAWLISTSGWASEATEARVRMDQAAQRSEGVVIARAVERTLQGELKAPGEVRANGYATVLVTPRVASQVIERKARLGDTVRAGQSMVTLSSVEVAEAQGALIVAEREWQRVSALGADAVSGRRYTEVKVQRDQARARLRAYGLSDPQVASLLRAGSSRADGSFDLLAPAAGRVTSDDFMLGERVEPGKTLFTLIDEDSVWVEAQLSPGDATRLRRGGPARIMAHGQSLKGEIIQLPHQANLQTRTVPVRVQVANRDDLLHQGEFVDVFVATGNDERIMAVPDEAVVLVQNQPTVFVVAGAGEFEAQPVSVGPSQGGWTAIREGLGRDQSIVVKGTFALKARLLKAQIGGDGH